MMNRLKNKILIVSPILATGFSWSMNRYVLTIISILTIFFCIGACDVCRKRENLWLFVLVGISVVPVNLVMSMYVSDYLGYLWNGSFIMKIIYFSLIYAVLFCLEEIILGIIGRIIWKNQYSVWANAYEQEEI